MARKFLNGIDLQNQRGINVGDPSDATDIANKQYVDNSISGLKWKREVRVATTANGTLASAFENGDTVDGVTLATGDRILLKDQTAQTENGIYVVAVSGAPARANDADSSAELNSATVLVMAGTVNADKAFTQTTDSPTVGSSNIVWASFGSGLSYTADGNGLELSGSTFGLELDGSTLSKSSSGLRVGSGAAGAGLVESSGVLAVGAGTGISVAADAISLDTSVAVRKYASNIGDGSATTFTKAHGLGTADLTVAVYLIGSPSEEVEPDVTVDSTNVYLAFATAPASNAYRLVAHG